MSCSTCKYMDTDSGGVFNYCGWCGEALREDRFLKGCIHYKDNREEVFIELQPQAGVDHVRPSFDEVFYTTAKLWALRSTCLRTKVGAVLVKDNRTISTGYNGNPTGFPHCTTDPSDEFVCRKIVESIPHGQGDEYCTAIHAEVNCIMQADPKDRVGASLYCTHSPCSSCAKLIVQGGIKEVYYIEGYPDIITKKLFNQANVKLIRR